jgi:Lrp/AsnC family transcriptional regulator
MSILDAIDVKLLRALQADASLSVGALAEQVNLSRSACWRRIKELEDRGVIRSRVTLLNGEQLGHDVTVIALVRTNRHDEKWLRNFTETLDGMPEVLEFYRMSGDVDYLLKIVARDIKDYDRIYRRLISKVDLLDVSSSFVMETLKWTTELPLESA